MEKVSENTYEYVIYYKKSNRQFRIIENPDIYNIYYNGTFGWTYCGKAVSLINAKEVIMRYLKLI